MIASLLLLEQDALEDNLGIFGRAHNRAHLLQFLASTVTANPERVSDLLPGVLGLKVSPRPTNLNQFRATVFGVKLKTPK